MANFNTHLVVASTASGLTAIGALNAGVIGPDHVLLYFSAGTLGGLLPDLDSDNSSLLRGLFTVIATAASFWAMLKYAQNTVIESVIVWLICFVCVYAGGFTVFKRMTVHRGIFHSIPAGMFLSGMVTTIGYYHAGLQELTAWITGAFVLLGYIVHLILDEICSVDMSNVRFKRSFGTALKVVDKKNKVGTVIAYLGAIIFLFYTPGFKNFINTVFKKSVYVKFQENVFPKGNWFSKTKK